MVADAVGVCYDGGMTNTTLYIATENSDLTEGRGSTIVTGVYTNPDSAVDAVKGRGTMGVGDGDVYKIDLENGSYTGNLYHSGNKFYGYRQRNGRWGYGYVNEGDDPEFDEYLRLKRKFGKL